MADNTATITTPRIAELYGEIEARNKRAMDMLESISNGANVAGIAVITKGDLALAMNKIRDEVKASGTTAFMLAGLADEMVQKGVSEDLKQPGEKKCKNTYVVNANGFNDDEMRFVHGITSSRLLDSDQMSRVLDFFTEASRQTRDEMMEWWTHRPTTKAFYTRLQRAHNILGEL